MYQYIEASAIHPAATCRQEQSMLGGGLAGSLCGVWGLRLGLQGPANGGFFKGA